MSIPVMHGYVTLREIDVFAPPREDMFTGQDSYLRRG